MTLFTEQLERGTAADDGQAAIAADAGELSHAR